MKQEIKLIYESKYTDGFAGHCGSPRKIEHTIDGEATLTEMLEHFEDFLNAIGYYIDKDSHLDFVKDDTNLIHESFPFVS